MNTIIWTELIAENIAMEKPRHKLFWIPKELAKEKLLETLIENTKSLTFGELKLGTSDNL